MNKIANHVKNNLAIYLVLLAVLVIFLIIKFIPKKEKSNYDTSMFNVVELKDADQLFQDGVNKVLFIGREGCSACEYFLPILQISMAKYHFYVSYLDINNLDYKSEDYKNFIKYLDYTYTLQGKTAEFSDFMGNTPMFIIIKNNKMVYGYIGTMTEASIEAMITLYGISYDNQ